MVVEQKPHRWRSLCLAGLQAPFAGSLSCLLTLSRVECRQSMVATTPASSTAPSTATTRRAPRCSCAVASRWPSGPSLSTELPSSSMRSFSTSARTADGVVLVVYARISLLKLFPLLFLRAASCLDGSKQDLRVDFGKKRHTHQTSVNSSK